MVGARGGFGLFGKLLGFADGHFGNQGGFGLVFGVELPKGFVVGIQFAGASDAHKKAYGCGLGVVESFGKGRLP